MGSDDYVDRELMLSRFKRLIGEITRGVLTRNAFLPWEMEILRDMETCQVEQRRKLEVLHQYQKAVQRQLGNGPGPPMKLSAFLLLRARQHTPPKSE